MFIVSVHVPELKVSVGVQSQGAVQFNISILWVSISVHPFASVTVNVMVINPGEYEAPLTVSDDPVPEFTPFIFQRYVYGDVPPVMLDDSVVEADVHNVVAPVIFTSYDPHGFEQLNVLDAVTGVVQHPVTVTEYVPADTVIA